MTAHTEVAAVLSFLLSYKQPSATTGVVPAKCIHDAVLPAPQAEEQQRLDAATSAATARADALASQLADCRSETERAQEEV